jgi:hypothetical protein
VPASKRAFARDCPDARWGIGGDWDLGRRKFGLRAWRRQRMLSHFNRAEINLNILLKIPSLSF